MSVFLLTPPCGGDRANEHDSIYDFLFLLTPPCGGDLQGHGVQAFGEGISTHAPVRGRSRE